MQAEGRKLFFPNVKEKFGQGCQMVSNQNINFGIFWALEWIMLICNVVNWNILRPFGIFYISLVYIVVSWFIFSLFGILYQEKSGNPGFGLYCFYRIYSRRCSSPYFPLGLINY
jgi:hypothetical protein